MYVSSTYICALYIPTHKLYYRTIVFIFMCNCAYMYYSNVHNVLYNCILLYNICLHIKSKICMTLHDV